MIQNGLSYLMQGRTTFVIAHRLSTMRRADQILVVEGGLILDAGRTPPCTHSKGVTTTCTPASMELRPTASWLRAKGKSCLKS